MENHISYLFQQQNNGLQQLVVKYIHEHPPPFFSRLLMYIFIRSTNLTRK